MASAPSASALSAVLRCRGNLWSRNPPTKRSPSAAGYGRGLTPAALRDAPGDRRQLSARWGQRGLTVAYAFRGRKEADDVGGGGGGATRRRGFPDKSHFSRLCRGHAHSAAPGVESAPVPRSLTHTVKSNLAVIHDGCSGIIRGFEPHTYATHVCKRIARGRASLAGLAKLSFAAPSFLNPGHVSVVLTGSRSPRSPLLSRLVDLKVLWRCEDGSQHLPEDNNNTHTDDPKEQGHIHSPTCPPRVTEDTPD